jgi:hypothetical protein
MINTKIYQLMHKYGKLTSCNEEKPHNIDELFANELLKLLGCNNKKGD